ncbi:MAG: hypothetical protein J6A01_04765 [Proteobacteria bacterium]|nr:hypothetical protein [Pseudomonadota bacterium]
MSEIVYFDANPTVRAILGKQFEQYGLKLVYLESLDQIAAVLNACRHPVVIVLDMSRNPEKLPFLQSVIPQYLKAPERCILMSVQPTTLAPYLPASIDECFFKHVIERPFKRLDFIQFFDEIVQPYLQNSKSLQQSVSSLVLNSGISQIVSQSLQVPVDNFRQEVEDIVISTSRAIPLSRLQETAQEQPRDDLARRDNRMSRRSRGAYPSRSNAPTPKEPQANSNVQESMQSDSNPRSSGMRETPSRIQNRIRHSSHASQAHESHYHSSPQQSDSQDRIHSSNAHHPDANVRATLPEVPTVHSDSQVRAIRSSDSGVQSDSQGRIHNSDAYHSDVNERATRPAVPTVHSDSQVRAVRSSDGAVQSDSQGRIITSNAPRSDSKGRAIRPVVRSPHSDSQPRVNTPRSDSQVREVSNVIVHERSDAQNLVQPADASADVYPLKHLSQSLPVVSDDVSSDKITQSIDAPVGNAFSEPIKQAEQVVGKSVEMMPVPALMDDDEVENTLNVSPEIMSGLIDPVPHSPSLIQPTVNESIIRTNFQITWLLNLIHQSHMSGDSYTIIIRKDCDFMIIVLQAGIAAWVEYIPGGQFMDAPSFIHKMASNYQMPKTEILALLKKNVTLSDALSSLHLESLMVRLCEDLFPQTLRDILRFEGCPTHVFRNVPSEWQKLVNSRPEHTLNILPYLFVTVRDNADVILPPQAFRSFRFASRSNRTPLNYSIQLNPHESDLLAALRMPKLLPELRISGKKNVTDTVYRLYLFEFVDVVF